MQIINLDDLIHIEEQILKVLKIENHVCESCAKQAIEQHESIIYYLKKLQKESKK